MLVLLFHAFVQPVTILVRWYCRFPVPSSRLFVTRHRPVSMPSMIGMIMLMGIATKNSILLVEYAVIVARRDRMA